MKNDEKARELANCQNCIDVALKIKNVKVCNPDERPCDRYKNLIKMSEWKDEQALKAFCKFQCPDILSESNRCQHQEFEEPCQSYKLFEKLLKGEE